MTLANPKETFHIRRPPDHWRKASCLEVGCPHYFQGWSLSLAISASCDHLNSERCDHHGCHWPEINWVRAGGTGRTFREVEQVSPNIFQFQFAPGQLCFRESTHRAPNGVDPLLMKGVGTSILTMDWDEWHTRFNEEMYQAERRLKEG